MSNFTEMNRPPMNTAKWRKTKRNSGNSADRLAAYNVAATGAVNTSYLTRYKNQHLVTKPDCKIAPHNPFHQAEEFLIARL